MDCYFLFDYFMILSLFVFVYILCFYFALCVYTVCLDDNFSFVPYWGWVKNSTQLILILIVDEAKRSNNNKNYNKINCIFIFLTSRNRGLNFFDVVFCKIGASVRYYYCLLKLMVNDHNLRMDISGWFD
jgi:hypothetical protein